MRNLYKIAVVILCISNSVLSHVACSDTRTAQISKEDSPVSYFFSDKESKAILLQIDSPQKAKNKALEKNNRGKYKLSGILFINPSNWTVWINGKPYHSRGQTNEFTITAVSNHSVLINCNDGNEIKLSLDMPH